MKSPVPSPNPGAYVGPKIRRRNLRVSFPRGSNESYHAGFLHRHVAELEQILRGEYGQPSHGNKPDLVDEIVFIMLSRRTRESAYSAAYESLKKAYPTWEAALAAPAKEFAERVRSAGLANRRSSAIRENLGRLRESFGSLDRIALDTWSDRRLFRYLTSLEEVGPKSALCVMMYSLGRRVFPADTHVLRVLRRLGFVPSGVDHKLGQRILARQFPPAIRRSLHVTLVAHGRLICVPRRPRCQSCPLQRFCRYYREQAQRGSPADTPSAPRIVDLFAGAGGMSTGFERAGMTPIAAVEASELALDTYYLNHTRIQGSQLISGDLRRVRSATIREVASGRVDGIIGGPPCQGFSLVGRDGRKGLKSTRPSAKNRLYQAFVRVVRDLQPRFFVMENVPHISAHRKGKFLEQVCAEFEAAGFSADSFRLDARDYGVAQKRRRILIVGFRGIDRIARSRLSVFRQAVNSKSRVAVPFSLMAAIGDLPSLERGEGVFYRSKNRRPENQMETAPASGTFNHVARAHMDRDVALFRLLSPGETAWHALYRHKAVTLMPYVKKNPDGSPVTGQDGLPVLEGFRDKFRKLRPDEPSPTIMAHMCKDANMYIHPNQARTLTVREAARVQSFDDGFVFLGGMTHQFTMIGNAVPPLLAHAIAHNIAMALSVGSEELQVQNIRAADSQFAVKAPAGIVTVTAGGRE